MRKTAITTTFYFAAEDEKGCIRKKYVSECNIMYVIIYVICYL